ncbi:hypothetical protein O9G_000513 [Rozella allomycis CSF55]|uniref:Outer arm dynein light chain 1 n=1 Tax=Rozella allomycis (strain CSF55) TaxID=988480 RepID=A0A075AVH3_ROZAC|nr:hypothetical protein O9G_000513 [Rozella allomycis CSF55]|eukprot:EPZ34326.1 hypothetical protein O9G_000513 [Rozella allomycis CSF55]
MLDNNRLYGRKSAADKPEDVYFANLTDLNLDGFCDDNLEEFCNLVEIDAGENNGLHIEGFGALKGLKTLKAPCNRISSFEYTYDSFMVLEDLDLSFNVLNDPNSFVELGKLPRLQRLNLSYNEISKIPVINDMSLNVSRNKISRIDFEPDLFPDLEKLDISKNKLNTYEDIEGLSKLTHIAQVNIAGNELTFALENGHHREIKFITKLEPKRDKAEKFTVIKGPKRIGLKIPWNRFKVQQPLLTQPPKLDLYPYPVEETLAPPAEESPKEMVNGSLNQSRSKDDFFLTQVTLDPDRKKSLDTGLKSIQENVLRMNKSISSDNSEDEDIDLPPLPLAQAYRLLRQAVDRPVTTDWNGLTLTEKRDFDRLRTNMMNHYGIEKEVQQKMNAEKNEFGMMNMLMKEVNTVIKNDYLKVHVPASHQMLEEIRYEYEKLQSIYLPENIVKSKTDKSNDSDVTDHSKKPFLKSKEKYKEEVDLQ